MQIFLYYFLLFLIYSFIGWIIEVISCFIIEKKFINRGFLIGPYCPIYGVAVLIMILYLTQYKDNLLTVFLLAFIICSFLEYVASYLMEKIFKARWWDYNDHKFNLNGRICLSNAIMFGLASVVVICFLNPIIENLIIKIPDIVLICLSIVLLILFIADCILSFNIIYKITRTAKEIKRDSTEEISRVVKQILSKKLFQRRIFSAFPSFKIIGNLKNKIKNQNKKQWLFLRLKVLFQLLNLELL